MKDFEIKITKRSKILEVNNDMAHNYYYLFYVRIYNHDHTKYRKAHFIVWFDIFDLAEFYEKNCMTKNEIDCYADELAYSGFIDNIKSFDNVAEFFELCNESIENYNKVC